MLIPVKIYRALTIAILTMTLFGQASFAADTETDAAVDAVRGFNAAIGARDMDAALAFLAEGSVALQLRAVHPGMSDNPPLTADLRKNWQMVAAILFPTTNAYVREVTVTNATADGEVATVWVDTTTRTDRKNESETMALKFSEVYLLVKKSDGWKIAVVADNRQPDNIAVTPDDGAD